MIDHSKEKAEKIKAFRKLMSKWLAVQATERKANLLLSKNPSIRGVKKGAEAAGNLIGKGKLERADNAGGEGQGRASLHP